MSGYPHEMGDAIEVWRRTTEYPGLGKVIILGSFAPAYLNPRDKEEQAKWIGQVTFSIDCVNNQQNTRTSGYMFSQWYDTQPEAVEELIRFMVNMGQNVLDISNKYHEEYLAYLSEALATGHSELQS